MYIEFILKDLKYERYEQSHFTFNIQYFNNNQYGTKKIKQTAGRDQLGTFAPKFAELNDDILFGEVWSRTEQLGLRDRSLVTITSLISQGITDSSLTFHLQSAKTTVLRVRKLQRSSLTSASMQDGRKHGRHSVLPKKYGMKISLVKIKMKKQRSNAK